MQIKIDIPKITEFLIDDIGHVYNNYKDKIFTGFAELEDEGHYALTINNFGYKKINHRETFLKFMIKRKTNLIKGMLYHFIHQDGVFQIVKVEAKDSVKESPKICLTITGGKITK